MPDRQIEFLVLGAGISGLTAAYQLKKAGKNVAILEKNETAGGVMQSIQQNGHTLELGPNSASSHEALLRLIESLGLDGEVLPADNSAGNRFIARNGTLHQVKPGPGFLLKSRLLSRKARWRILKEPFIKSVSTENESVAQFFTRRLGPEVYRYMINPVLGGIYAGDPEKMSMKAVMPKMIQWEKEYGSLFNGLRKNKSGLGGRQIISLRRGMGVLTTRLASQLSEELILRAKIKKIIFQNGSYQVEYQKAGELTKISSPSLVWALPAHQAHLLSNIHSGLSSQLLSIPYVSMGIGHLIYDQENLPKNPNGFGFLIPEAESKTLLGAIWNTSVFSQNQPEGKQVFTLFVGGSRTPFSNRKTFEATIPQAIRIFSEIMNINTPPLDQHSYFWPKAIPQYSLKHPETVKLINESLPEGLHLVGNFLNGVSVGDCVGHAMEKVEEMI